MAGTDQGMNLLPDEITLDSCRYLRRGILGRGAYGIVGYYEAPDPNNRARTLKLAVKCDSGTASTVSKEAYYMNKLAHAKVKQVPKFYYEKYHQQKPYIVMQCIEYSVPEYI